MPWLHLKVQAHRSICKTLICITLVRGAGLSTEGELTICFPIWCDEWSVICKLFYIKSALLISVCWSENLVLSGSSCSGGELLLFHLLMDISSLFLLQMHCQLLSEMGNLPWSRRSYEANKVLVSVLDIKQTSCACCSLTWSSPCPKQLDTCHGSAYICFASEHGKYLTLYPKLLMMKNDHFN